MKMASVSRTAAEASDSAVTDDSSTDMRKALPRDVHRETVRDGKKGRKVVVQPE